MPCFYRPCVSSQVLSCHIPVTMYVRCGNAFSPDREEGGHVLGLYQLCLTPFAVWPHSQPSYNSRQCQESVMDHLTTCKSISQFPNGCNTIASPFRNLHDERWSGTFPASGTGRGGGVVTPLFSSLSHPAPLLRAAQPCTGKAASPVVPCAERARGLFYSDYSNSANNHLQKAGSSFSGGEH